MKNKAHYNFGQDGEIAQAASDYFTEALLPFQSLTVNGNSKGPLCITHGNPWQREDTGDWVLKRLPKHLRDMATQEQIDAFNTAYPNTIEDIEPSWCPAIEE